MADTEVRERPAPGSLNRAVPWDADGEIPYDFMNPQPVGVSTLPDLSENVGRAMPVRGLVCTTHQAISISTSQYAAFDTIGTILKLSREDGSAILPVAGGTALLQSLTIMDDRAQLAVINIMFLDSPLLATVTDNAVFPTMVIKSDWQRVLGLIPVLAADYQTVVSGRTAFATKANIGLLLRGRPSSQDLYVVMMTPVSTPTYTTTDDLHLQCEFLVN